MLLAEPALKMRWFSSHLWSCVPKALCIRAVDQSQTLECSRGLALSLVFLCSLSCWWNLSVFLLITAECLAHSTNAESLNSLCTVIPMAMVEVWSVNYLLEGKCIYKTEGKDLNHRITEQWRLEGASSSPRPQLKSGSTGTGCLGSR